MTEIFIPVKFADGDQVEVTVAITLIAKDLPVDELANIAEAVESKANAAVREALREDD